MDITTILSALDGISIVAWFALLVVVFAVFVGLGIYQGRRSEAEQLKRDESLTAARRAHARVHQKEFT